MSEIRELPRVRVEATIKLLSGLHIGAGKESIEIGGIDNPVIKHPHTGEPYIPGSSIKGRLRFLMEWAFGTVRDDGKPWGFNEDAKQGQTTDLHDPMLRIFGNAIKEWKGGPSRLIVRDAPLAEKDRERYRASPNTFFEEKTEVTINRIEGKALDGGLHTNERVAAGTEFDFALVFRRYNTGDGGRRDNECLNWVLQGLDLLEQDALGGSGSRGYGRIRFENLRLFHQAGEQNLDNVFRGHKFSRDTAPAIWTSAA